VSLTLALGSHTPVYALVARLPVVSGLRYPVKALVDRVLDRSGRAQLRPWPGARLDGQFSA
jgi:hypothetical protein